MYEFWYNNVKPKYGENATLCYMDTANFIVHVKTDDIYKDITENVETRFGILAILNYTNHFLKEKIFKELD